MQALVAAFTTGNFEKVKTCLDVDFKDKKIDLKNPLLKVIIKQFILEGNMKAADYFLDYFHDTPEINSFDDVALVVASKRGDEDKVKFFLDKGAQMGEEKSQALIQAYQGGYLKIVQLLLESISPAGAGANLRQIFADVTDHGNLSLLKLLLDKYQGIVSEEFFKLKSLGLSSKTRPVNDFLKSWFVYKTPNLLFGNPGNLAATTAAVAQLMRTDNLFEVLDPLYPLDGLSNYQSSTDWQRLVTIYLADFWTKNLEKQRVFARYRHRLETYVNDKLAVELSIIFPLDIVKLVLQY